MKKYLLLLAILIFPAWVNADLGAPRIQAICKIRLKNGSVIEGIIPFGGGGYYYNYKPHGFCMVHHNSGYALKLFNLDFRRLTPTNNASFRNGTSSLFFVTNVSKQPDPEKDYKYDNSTRVLTKRTTELDEYRLDTVFKIYLELPECLHIRLKENNDLKTVEIKISDIESFELVRNPSKEWLELIDNARKNLKTKAQEDEDYEKWMDYIEPSWYHEIIKDKEQYQYLKQFF